MTVFGKELDPDNQLIKFILDKKLAHYREVQLEYPELKREIRTLTGYNKIPVVFVGHSFLGGWKEVLELEK